MTSPPADLVLVADAVFTPGERLAPGWVHVRDGRIADAGAGPAPPVEAALVRLPEGACIAPGFIDLHVHGGGGAQVGPDPHAVGAVARFHARHGTTGLLATTVPGSEQTLADTVRAVAAVARRPDAEAAQVLGCHLEGPFLSAARPGALEVRHLRAPDLGELERLLDAGGGSVQMIAVAPELPGALELIAAAAAEGVVVAIGHTDATCDEALAGIDHGARAATHLFNAMRPLHHREPGAVGAMLTAPRVTAELIADGVHIHPMVLRLAHAAKGPGRLALVTDAMQAAGLPDGDYALGEQAIAVRGGEARTAAGALAGSTLTMDRAVRVCVEQAGIPLADALTMASATPATLLGVGAVTGLVGPGADADLVVLDERLHAIGTMVAGRWAFRDEALSRRLDAAAGGSPEPADGGRADARARP
jgi:N-acetylglucosamine-6-phosphate deacetylase